MNFDLSVYDDTTGEVEFACCMTYVDNYVIDFVAIAKLLRVHFPYSFQIIRLTLASPRHLPSIDNRFDFIRPYVLSDSFSFTFWYDFCCKLEHVAYRSII